MSPKHNHSTELVASFVAGNLHRFKRMSISNETCSIGELKNVLREKDPCNKYDVESTDEGTEKAVVVNGGKNIIYAAEATPEDDKEATLDIDAYLHRLHTGDNDNTSALIVIFTVVAITVILAIALT